jgi:hypothetical protein
MGSTYFLCQETFTEMFFSSENHGIYGQMAVQAKQGLSQLDKKIIGILLIAILAIVTAVGLAYWVFSQSNQTNNTVPNSPSPEPTPTQSPAATPTPIPTGEGPANLVINVKELSFATDSGLKLLIAGDITNTGAQTAYNVKLHIQTWFSNGSKGMDAIETLNREVVWFEPFRAVNITSGDTFTLTSRWFPKNLVVSVPREFWLDNEGYVYPYDLISSYVITPLWEDTP